MDSFDSSKIALEVVSRFNKLLAEAGDQIQSSRKAWTEHIQAVESQRAILEKEYPAPLIVNAWASQNAVLAALRRLQAYDGLLKKRMQALLPVFHGIPQFDIITMLGAALQQRPISSETRSWQLISAISGVQFLITESSLLADKLEKAMTYRLEAATKSHKSLTATFENPGFAIICAGAKVLDGLKDEVDDSVDIDREQELKEVLEEAYDRGMKAVRCSMPKIERNISIMHLRMTAGGIRVARQTLIWEYFPQVDNSG